MKIHFIKDIIKREKNDCLIIPFWEEKKSAQIAVKLKKTSSIWSIPVEEKDFIANEGNTLFVYVNNETESRILLVGLGKKKNVSSYVLRHAYGKAIKAVMQKKLKKVVVLTPSDVDIDAVCEGMMLSNYTFNRMKKDSLVDRIDKATIVTSNVIDKSQIKRIQTICTGVYLTRDLVNNNADEETPKHLASVAKDFSQINSKLKVLIRDKKWIEKEKMGLITAVSKGASVDPYFIQLEYKGDPSSNDHTVIIGKGVTYDTGGLSLKPSTSMDTMKTDMAGAATILGTMYSIATMDMKINVTGIIPTVENAIGPNSYKPGDVYKSYLGKTVEVINTDAEGRLILADALSYASEKLSPTRIIDIATLTGAISISLGEEIAGMFSSDKDMAKDLKEAARKTGEYLWQLPLYPDYISFLQSDIADIKNCGDRKGGSIQAALFLKEFVSKNTPWAHIDIGGTAYLSKERNYLPAYATGYGVRLFISFFEKISQK